MSNVHLTESQIIQIAAEVGAKAALAKIDAERQQDLKERVDRRLRNTKLLLKNYRLFKAHAEHAIFEAEEENPQEILESLMMPGRDGTLIVESIKRSSARTAVIVRHMETMMQLYHAYCTTSGSEDDMRRWRVVYRMYISDDRMTAQELAAEEKVVIRTIYKDIDSACDKISTLMFGIDGVNATRKKR